MERGEVLPAGTARGRILSVEQIVERFREHRPGRRRAPPGPAAATLPLDSRGDHDLNPDMAPRQPLRPAAVLVGLVPRATGITLLMTQRTESLPDHGGQVSFPGGRVHAGDADAVAAALREAEEEIGLGRAHVRPIGRLDTYVTRTGFEVTPVVAVATPPFELVPDPREVALIFELPLDFALDPVNHRLASRVFEGRMRYFYEMPWGDHYIWGATAGMLVNLAEVLNGTA